MLSATISGVQPVKAAITPGAVAGQSFSSLLGDSQVSTPSLPVTKANGLPTNTAGKPGRDNEPHKAFPTQSIKAAADLPAVLPLPGETPLKLPLLTANVTLLTTNAPVVDAQPFGTENAAERAGTAKPASAEKMPTPTPGTSASDTSNPAALFADPPLAILAQPAAWAPPRPTPGTSASDTSNPTALLADPPLADSAQSPAGAPKKTAAAALPVALEARIAPPPSVAGTPSASIVAAATGSQGDKAAALKAAIAPQLPSVSGAPMAPAAASTGSAVHSVRPIDSGASVNTAKPGNTSENAAAASTPEKLSSGIARGDTGKSIAPPLASAPGSTLPATGAPPAVGAASTAAAVSVSPSALPPSAGGPLLFNELAIPIAPTPGSQGNAPGTITATPAFGRHDKPREDSAATTGSAQSEGDSGVTAPVAAPARILAGVVNAAGAGSPHDSGASLSPAPQPSTPAPDGRASAATNTVATETTAAAGANLDSVTQARVLHSLSGSEMHVNLNSEEFGRVSVHAAYGRDSITTQISLENSAMGNALGSALSTHLPNLEVKLGQEHGLPSSVTVAMQSGSESGASSQGRNADPQSQSRSPADGAQQSLYPSSLSTSSMSSDGPLTSGQSTPALTEASASRLDIRI